MTEMSMGWGTGAVPRAGDGRWVSEGRKDKSRVGSGLNDTLAREDHLELYC